MGGSTKVKENTMGLFKKNVDLVEKDEDIRREIRARVARQAGIYDEDYINTGILGGQAAEPPLSSPAAAAPESVKRPAPVAEAALVSEPETASEPIPAPAAAAPAPEPAAASEPAAAQEPEPKAESKQAAKPVPEAAPAAAASAPAPAKAAKPAKAPKPEKTPKPPRQKREKASGGDRGDRRPPKGRKGPLALLIIILLAMVPVGYAIVSLNDCPNCTEQVPCAIHCPDCTAELPCPLHCLDCTAEVPCPLHCPDCLDGGYCAIHNPEPDPEPPARQVDGSLPVPSLDLYVSGGSDTDVQWTGKSGIAGYEIERKTGDDGTWEVVKDIARGFTSWLDEGPEKGETCYYRICSYKVVDGVKVYSEYSKTKKISF